MKLFFKSQLNRVLPRISNILILLLLLSASKVMAYSKALDISQLPSTNQKTWQVTLQAPKQTLWQGQASQWYLISLNPPNGTADIHLPQDENFTFLAGKAIVVNNHDKIGWAYPIQITPKRSGSLTVPEFKISYSATTLLTPSQQVSVSSPQITPRMQVALSVDKNDIYLGQSLRLTTSWIFDFPVKALKNVNLHIPSLLDERFSVVTPWNKANENSKKSIGLPVNGQRQIAHWENIADNQVRIFFETVIKPKQIGDYQIEPATLLAAVILKDDHNQEKRSKTKKNKTVKGNFKGTQYLAYYNNQFFEALSDKEQVKRIFSKSTPLSFTVKSLPGNAPDNFSGIVGRPVIEANAQPTQVKKGQAIQYALTIVHPDIETLPLPSLTQFPSITQSFKVPSEPSSSLTKQGSIVVNQRLFPRRADIAAIPALTINYLEPESGLYRDLTIDSLAIEVEDNDSFNFSDIEGNKTIVLKNTIQSDPEGIWALRWRGLSENTLGVIEQNKPLDRLANLSWLLLLLLLLPPLLVAALIIKPINQRFTQQRLKQPVMQLRLALKQGKDPLLHLSKYCQLRFGLVPSKFTASQLRSTLRDYLTNLGNHPEQNTKTNCQVIKALSDDFSLWLEQYQARYSQKVSGISTDEATQLLTIIDRVEQYLPRYQQTYTGKVKQSAGIKNLSIFFSTMTYLLLLGLASHSSTSYAMGIDGGVSGQEQAITVAHLHQAHQQALQLSIDSPHKGSLAHAKVAEQLASFRYGITVNKDSLFYDIGTSWFLAKRYGDSIVWLRRAQNLSSDDDVILHNLAQARAKRLDQLPDNFSPSWLGYLHNIISSITWLGLCYLSYCLFWITAWRRVTHKDLTNKRLVFAFVLVSFAGITQVAKFQYQPQLSEAVITSQEVISRKGPGLLFSPAFTTPLHEGAELIILKSDGQWSEVKLTNGEVCWLPTRAVTLI